MLCLSHLHLWFLVLEMPCPSTCRLFPGGFPLGGGRIIGNSPWEDQQRDWKICQRVKENSVGCDFILRRAVYCGPYHKLTPAHTWGTIRGGRDSNWGQLVGRQVPYFLWYSPSSLSSRTHCFWRKKIMQIKIGSLGSQRETGSNGVVLGRHIWTHTECVLWEVLEVFENRAVFLGYCTQRNRK